MKNKYVWKKYVLFFFHFVSANETQWKQQKECMTLALFFEAQLKNTKYIASSKKKRTNYEEWKSVV